MMNGISAGRVKNYVGLLRRDRGRPSIVNNLYSNQGSYKHGMKITHWGRVANIGIDILCHQWFR